MKTPYERAVFLNKTAALIRERASEIAKTLTAENGADALFCTDSFLHA